MNLRKRLDRIEAKRGTNARAAPSVIFLCSAETGEPSSALIVGGGTIGREPGESREAFEARASAGAPVTIHLPDNGRDALATGKAPQWAQGALVMKALREKHGDPE